MRALIAAVLLCACTNTGQQRVAVPLWVAGDDLSAKVIAEGQIALSVEHAQLAFGPLYLCAGNTAGELCDTARLEWLDTRVVDLADPVAYEAGELTGVTGSVHSYMYDLGISSQLTRDAPYVLQAAHTLDGASLRVDGYAELAAVRVPFHAALAIEQSSGTEQGVPVVRKSVSEDFAHDVRPEEAGLLVRFDARPWLRRIDLRSYLEDARCAVGGPARVCAGQVEHTCNAEGESVSQRDCALAGQACLKGTGCTDALSFEDGSEPYRALRDALLVGQRPTFEWGFTP